MKDIIIWFLISLLGFAWYKATPGERLYNDWDIFAKIRHYILISFQISLIVIGLIMSVFLALGYVH